jgi:RNA polymerase sigma factor (sigma-70 family)
MEVLIFMSKQKSVDWVKDLQSATRKESNMLSLVDEQQGTNSSLLRQIKHLSNAPGWALFYQTYAPLLDRFAAKFRLTPAEREDVIQNTMIQLSKNISNFDRSRGSFKAFLYRGAKWKILDLLKARPRNTVDFQRTEAGADVDAPLAEWEPAVTVFERIWDAEWDQQLLRDALEEARKKVSGVHFQIFCLNVLEELPASKVAEMLGVRASHVHLVTCRVRRLVRKELAALRQQ